MAGTQRLLHCPLAELVRRAANLSRCDAAGARLPGAPWAFQLAYNNSSTSPCPTIKTVGFQRVTAKGIEFLVRRRSDAPALASGRFPASLCYYEGEYPPTTGGVCSQWRAEGTAVEVDLRGVLDTAPLSSFAQIIACGDSGCSDSTGTSSPASDDGADADTVQRIRLASTSVEPFVADVRMLKKSLEHGELPDAKVRAAVQVFRLEPTRMELLHAGAEIWERFEWVGSTEAWSGPHQLMPY